jgi:Na+/melibiose symporter-like transporter
MKVLVVKFITASVISLFILGVYTNLNTGQILLLSFAVTVITYLIGDLLILPLFNNTTAAVADAGMSWLILYLASYIWPAGNVSLLSALTAAAIIGVGEIFLHGYMEAYVLHCDSEDSNTRIAG